MTAFIPTLEELFRQSLDKFRQWLAANPKWDTAEIAGYPPYEGGLGEDAADAVTTVLASYEVETIVRLPSLDPDLLFGDSPLGGPFSTDKLIDHTYWAIKATLEDMLLEWFRDRHIAAQSGDCPRTFS